MIIKEGFLSELSITLSQVSGEPLTFLAIEPKESQSCPSTLSPASLRPRPAVHGESIGIRGTLATPRVSLWHLVFQVTDSKQHTLLAAAV